MDYGEVITKSARLVWKHKILWVFGLLAALGGGSGTPNLNIRFTPVDFTSDNLTITPFFRDFYSALDALIRPAPGLFLFMLFLLVCGLGLVFFLIGVLGRTGLTRGAWLADDGSERLEFGSLLTASLPAFWRVAGLSLVVGLPGFAIALMLILFYALGLAASFSQELPGVAIILLCVGLPLLCLLVPFFWFLGIWSEISTVAVVGEGRGIFDGLRRGWQFIRRHLGPVLLVAVMVLVARLAFGFLAGLLLAPIGIGALLGGLIFTGDATFNWGFILPFLLAAIPLSLFLGAIFQSFIGALWTLVFRRLAAAEAVQPDRSVP